MGNSDSSQAACYFGKDVPEALKENEVFNEDLSSLTSVLDAMGTPKEVALLSNFLQQVDPADLEENRELCEFAALACIRFRRHDMATAWDRFQKYITWRRKTFGNLGPQDLDASDTHSPVEEEDANEEDTRATEGGGKQKKLTTTRSLLDLGVISLLPKTTSQGHAVVLLRFAQTRPSAFKHHARQVCKACHYTYMTALRRFPSSQVRGIVVIADFKGAALANIDRKVPQKMGKLLSGILPVRLAGLLLCNPNLLVRIVVPLAKMFLSKKLAARLHVVSHNDSLQTTFGLDESVVPVETGGTGRCRIAYEDEFHATSSHDSAPATSDKSKTAVAK